MRRGCGVASAMLLVLAARCCVGQQFEGRVPPANVLNSRKDFHLHHGGIDGDTIKRAMKHKFKSWNTRRDAAHQEVRAQSVQGERSCSVAVAPARVTLSLSLVLCRAARS